MLTFYATMVSRHTQKAREWEDKGKPDYAAGSYRKAAKWRNRARELDFSVYGPHPKTQIELLLDERLLNVMDEIAQDLDEIMFGPGIRSDGLSSLLPPLQSNQE